MNRLFQLRTAQSEHVLCKSSFAIDEYDESPSSGRGSTEVRHPCSVAQANLSACCHERIACIPWLWMHKVKLLDGVGGTGGLRDSRWLTFFSASKKNLAATANILKATSSMPARAIGICGH